MKWMLSLIATAFLVSTSLGQSTAVAPTALTATEGAGLYIYNGPITFQQVYAPSQLAGLPVGSIITGMQLRLDSSFLESPASTVANFDVSIGPSNFAPGSLSSSVVANQGAGTVLVRSGSLTFNAGSFPVNNSPNSFGPLINFTNSFTYNGGNLLLTVSHTAPSAELDFDVGSGIAGAQIFQAQSYNASTLTDSSLDTGIAVQFTFTTAVPEPATMFAVGIGTAVCGAAVYRWKKQQRRLRKLKSA